MRVLALVLAMAAIGCGGSEDAHDAGPVYDARRYADATVTACSLDAACQADSRTPVCDTDRSRCVECTGDSDCQSTGALGNVCETSSAICQCQTDDDCADNLNGVRCHEVARACTCIDDKDCAGPSTCELDPYLGAGVRTCRVL